MSQCKRISILYEHLWQESWLHVFFNWNWFINPFAFIPTKSALLPLTFIPPKSARLTVKSKLYFFLEISLTDRNFFSSHIWHVLLFTFHSCTQPVMCRHSANERASCNCCCACFGWDSRLVKWRFVQEGFEVDAFGWLFLNKYDLCAHKYVS